MLTGGAVVVLISAIVVVLVIAAVFMATFNASMNYLSKTYNFEFKQQISFVEALAIVVLLAVVGGLVFKSMCYYPMSLNK